MSDEPCEILEDSIYGYVIKTKTKVYMKSIYAKYMLKNPPEWETYTLDIMGRLIQPQNITFIDTADSVDAAMKYIAMLKLIE